MKGSSMSYDAIDRFVADVRADFIKPTILSEHPPKDPDVNRKQPLVTITGKTFLSDVVESPAEVLLALDGPRTGCPACTALAPELAAVAALFAPEDRLWVARMDLSQNELPKHLRAKVTGYPSLLFFHGDDSAGGRNVSVYDDSYENDASFKSGDHSAGAPKRAPVMTATEVAKWVLAHTRLNTTATGSEGEGAESPIRLDDALKLQLLVPPGLYAQTVALVEWYIRSLLSFLGDFDGNEEVFVLPLVGVTVRAYTLLVAYVALLAALCVVLGCLVVDNGVGGGSADGNGVGGRPAMASSSPATSTPAASVDKAELEKIRSAMKRVYAKHKPENVLKMEAILRTWAGKEHLIIPALQDKYGKVDRNGPGDEDDADYEVVSNETPFGELASDEAAREETKKDK
jgi:hypothetical protein